MVVNTTQKNQSEARWTRHSARHRFRRWHGGCSATGSDTRSMAREMLLSEHTIQDHLKSIFAKTGAQDRVTVL
jgi:Bacterial regulatory proteins, luxR family